MLTITIDPWSFTVLVLDKQTCEREQQVQEICDTAESRMLFVSRGSPLDGTHTSDGMGGITAIHHPYSSYFDFCIS